MAGKPAATIGSNHTCPMCTGTTPHVGGPITQGEPTVLFNGKPVATMGSMCTCVGPPDTIVQGNPTVLINGKPIACVGDMSGHGGVIVSGSSNIIIGNGGSSPTATMSIKKIPFPEITFINRVLGNARQAIANQEKIKKLSKNNEGEPKIYGVEWIYEDEKTKNHGIFQEVTVKARVLNIPDGESITFSIKRPTKIIDKQGNTSESEENIVELSGTVVNKEVKVTWEIEKKPEEDNKKSKSTEK